ncbi:hypothetical protein VPNG_03073 [Cytospora leucostoma]|uniref:Uncharacterized protein n=1 Tax=Cytospora leucostoma TaxID=1230097 RepID=A0A423XGC1_9PEZI|nr:hypothetical protein VPNG_03073 [Cytospora leucostoma]
MNYSLPEDNATTVPEQWFDRQLKRHIYKSPILKGFLAEEFAALKAYHSGKLSTIDAAHAITSPISNSPIPNLGTYSDEASAVCQLWVLLTDALVEWPSSRTADLVALLVAISKLPGGLHRGEATDDDEKPLAWKDSPYIGMIWSDATWMTPGDLMRRTPVADDDGAARQRVRLVYIKQQDVEARLVREGIFEAHLGFQFLIRTLEKIPGPQDETEASTSSEAAVQLKLDFLIPAAACWLKHNGRRFHDGLVRDELKGWEKRMIPDEALEFTHPAERWTYWEKRLREIAESGPDETTREAAQRAVGYMQAVDE